MCKAKPIEIVDVILHRSKYMIQRFVVISRRPEIVYERKGEFLVGEDSGIFNFYKHGACGATWKAFAGREFDIPLKDGTAEHAHGQWWDAVPPDYQGLVVRQAFSTVEQLAECYVFCGYYMDATMLDEWLATNAPSNNYYKYDQHHKDFGKSQIVSKGEATT